MMRICVARGDARMEYATDALAKKGYEVTREIGHDQLDALVLPVRASNTPPELIRSCQERGILVVGGMLPVAGAGCFDYMKDEAFLYENARITAEGAVMLLGTQSKGVLYGADVAIVGMGRIAECLCMMLCALQVRVSVYARRPEVLSRARTMGARTVCFSGELPASIATHDAVCNTVPHLLFDAQLLGRLEKETMLVELASDPGGFDRSAALQYGLHIINGQGIPGKYAPRAAGELIAAYTGDVLRRERDI